jgi:hypothetical protein
MTAKNTTKTQQPAPSKQPAETAVTGDKVDPVATNEQQDSGDDMPVTGLISEEAANVVSMRPAKGKRENIFETQAVAMREQAAAKVAVMGTVRQRLAHAFDLFSEGGEKEQEAKEEADASAIALYQARRDGIISADEVTAALGDIFGYKSKDKAVQHPVTAADPKASRTPFGQGEAIRKRIVRAVQAAEHVDDVQSSRFFEGLDKGKVADVLNRLGNEANPLSIWSAYDYLAEIKRQNMVRTNPAFDPKRVAGIVEALSEEGAADIVAANPALVTAYGALLSVLRILGEEAAKKAA